MWLVVVDTMQIQPYIFGSNRLRENVGASYLVDAITRDWAFEAVREVALGKNNIGPQNVLRDSARIENGLDAEVLYAGGGNFVVLFSGIDKAKKFHSNLSRRALLEAPGLQIVIAQQEMEWRKHMLRDKLDEVFHTLAVQKRNHVWSAPLLGLGVTAACSSTGLPATGMTQAIGDDPGYLASDEIRAKVYVATRQGSDPSPADQRLQEVIELAAGYSYPSDFEDLGATAGEYSHIAVVHADGNGIGQCIRDISDKYATVDTNRDFVLELRKFSINVEDAAKKALNAVLDRLKGAIAKSGGTSIVYEPNRNMLIQIKLTSGKSGYYVPFRPIVFGGDDVTFVCDGRLGLSLAMAYLREFEQQTARAGLGKDGDGLTACAGIAIVKSHYPFARAYALAAELTRSAKFYRTDNTIAGSCLDWHFALSGLGGSIREIRAREYEADEGPLTLRPVTLDANPWYAQHAWPVVRRGIKAFQEEKWAGRRNKIKALRDALREGPSAVKHFVVAFNNRADLPLVLPEMQNWPSTGWHGDSCGYFDAIELADWFIPLEGEADATPATAPAS